MNAVKALARKIRRSARFPSSRKASRNSREYELLRILDECNGHKRSWEQQECVNQQGDAIPWFTFPAIEYLEQLNLSEKTVLEWGCGNSTLYFSPRVKAIDSIEHNPEWFQKVKNNQLSNHRLVLAEENDYAATARMFDTRYDIIVNDGIRRDECAAIAPSLLNENGLIIYDNADRDPDVCAVLRANGFIEVDMHGFGPINPYTWTTSFFFSRNFDFDPLDRQPIIPKGGGY